MAVWNTRISVIANLEAASEEDALVTLRAALTRAGFEVYDGEADAFAAEAGTELTPLPATARRRPGSLA